MSKRARARKEQREREKLEFWDGQRAARREQTAGMRRLAAWAGLVVAGGLVLAGLVIGGIRLFQTYAPLAKISGPFGSITRSELVANKFAILQTSEGDIKIELDTQNTPKTAANFVLLAQKDFYNGIRFHRIMKDFMIQSGDPLSKNEDPEDDGQGGPGYQFDSEKITGDYIRGTLAMANSGADTNGSQFFIMHKTTELPKNYVIFGQVVAGMEVVDKVAETPVKDNGTGEMSQPTKDVVINQVILSDR